MEHNEQILHDFNITYFILFDAYTSLIVLHNTIIYTTRWRPVQARVLLAANEFKEFPQRH